VAVNFLYRKAHDKFSDLQEGGDAITGLRLLKSGPTLSFLCRLTRYVIAWWSWPTLMIQTRCWSPARERGLSFVRFCELHPLPAVMPSSSTVLWPCIFAGASKV